MTLLVREDNTEKFMDELPKAIKRALVKIGETAVTYAAAACPVDTGLLRNSIAYALSGEPASVSSYRADKGDGSGSYSGNAPEEGGKSRSVYIGTNVEYAKHVELGTESQDAQPFLKPAASAHVTQYEKILKNELKG